MSRSIIGTTSLRFRLPAELGILEITPEVLEHFNAHKQRRLLSREAGGQLFATFAEAPAMNILEATGPRPTDKRSPYNYEPDRIPERAEIKDRYARGLHFVGDWHTHRQERPSPSRTDEHNIRELVRFSSHDLAGFVLIIIGRAAFPEGMYVSFHSKTEGTRLIPVKET